MGGAPGRRSSGSVQSGSQPTARLDPQDIFDAARYRKTQLPLLQAHNLPREVYTSEAWYNREIDRVFHNSWCLLGREDEIPEPGDYLAIDTEWTGPVAICRGKDGGLHAFANVCAHRGAKVLQGERGRGSKVGLVCPYHAWTYDYDGKLSWAPGMQQTVDFDEDKIRLDPVRLETFHGFLFVCVNPHTPPLLETLGDMPTKLAPWFGPNGAAESMVCAGRREYTVPCNWKFLMENTSETYHTSTVHKDSLGPMKATPFPPHVGEWDAVQVPTGRSVVPLPTDFEGERAPLPEFTDQTFFINLFPGLQINVTHDCLWWMRIHPDGPSQSKVQQGFCFPRATTALPHFPAVFEKYRRRWHLAVSEDNAISVNQQAGARSPFRKTGRFCQLEFGTHNFSNWLISKMIDGSLRWDSGARVIVGDTLWSNDDSDLALLLQNT